MQRFLEKGAHFSWCRLHAINGTDGRARIVLAGKLLDLGDGEFRGFTIADTEDGEPVKEQVCIGRDGMLNPVVSYRSPVRLDDGTIVTREVSVTVLADGGFVVEGPYELPFLDGKMLVVIAASVSALALGGMIISLLLR